MPCHANSNGAPMSRLMLVSVTPPHEQGPASQWAHDIRNALAITSLHLETLERLSGSAGRKAASAAQAVMKRAVGMCNASLTPTSRAYQGSRRRGFDLMATLKEIAAILEPVAPEGFEIRLPAFATCMVMADPGEIFRIVFNLVQNAIAVARKDRRLTHVSIEIRLEGSEVAVLISDDGPGLPKAVRSRLFRPTVSSSGGNGFGIAIARELAERNGATLKLADHAAGTNFILRLAGLRTISNSHARIP